MLRAVAVLLFIAGHVLRLAAQEQKSPGTAHHFSPTVGFGWYSFRDFGTSPLFYSGSGVQLSMGDRWEKPRGHVWFNTAAQAALMSANVPLSTYLQASGRSLFLDFRLDGGYLHRFEMPLDERWEVKAGGGVVADLLLRQNNALGNAQVGTDIVSNVLLSGELSRDLSRQQQDTLDLKLIRLRRKPTTQRIDFRLDVGVLNFNYRPGYAYVHDSELTGEPGLAWVLADHRWKMNGWRLGTALGFMRRHGNGNATRLEYRWEAVHAPGRYRALQFASHTLRFVFMFNTSKVPK